MFTNKKNPILYLIIPAIFFFLLTSMVPVNCQQEEESETNKQELAQKALEEGDYQKAIQIYSSVLQSDPGNLAVQAHLARSYYLASNQNPDYLYQAAKHYNQLTQQVPDFSLPYLELGQIAYLLALNSKSEKKEKDAQDLYDSSLSWYNKYIDIEIDKQGLEAKRNIAVAKILKAILYCRMGKKDTASQLVAGAEKEYRVLSLSAPKENLEPFYDYFVKSGVEYLNQGLFNQALIYLEGAWLIEARSQVRSLMQNAVKAKDTSVSLLEPLPQPEEKKPPQKTPEQKIEQLTSEIDTLSKKLEGLSSLEPKVRSLEKEVEKLKTGKIPAEEEQGTTPPQPQDVSSKISLSERIDDLYAKVESLQGIQERVSELEATVENFSRAPTNTEKAPTSSPEVSELSGRVQQLEKEVQELKGKVDRIKSVADKFGILTLQINELRETVDKLRKEIAQQEKTGSQKPAPQKETQEPQG